MNEEVQMSGGAGALAGQTVVVIGGSGGIGFETARLARSEGAEVVLTGRNPERLENAASEVGAKSTAAFDAADEPALEAFFADLETPIDHVLSTAGRSRSGGRVGCGASPVPMSFLSNLLVFRRYGELKR